MSNYRTVTLKGNPITLIGKEQKIGEPAPPFHAIQQDLSAKEFQFGDGKVYVISAVPSLDTPVCDTETRKFNDIAAKLSDDVEIITISMDLPFAQKRWCGAAGVDRVTVVSDYRDADFGQKYGVLIEELRLLARAIFVIDREDVIRYIQIVPEIGQEPDYDEVVETVKKLL